MCDFVEAILSFLEYTGFARAAVDHFVLFLIPQMQRNHALLQELFELFADKALFERVEDNIYASQKGCRNWQENSSDSRLSSYSLLRADVRWRIYNSPPFHAEATIRTTLPISSLHPLSSLRMDIP
jgi:hypothetical protein